MSVISSIPVGSRRCERYQGRVVSQLVQHVFFFSPGVDGGVPFQTPVVGAKRKTSRGAYRYVGHTEVSQVVDRGKTHIGVVGLLTKQYVVIAMAGYVRIDSKQYPDLLEGDMLLPAAMTMMMITQT